MRRSLSTKIALASLPMLIGGCAMNHDFATKYRVSNDAASLVQNGNALAKGQAQLNAGLYAMAIESFRAEIRRDPESAAANNGLAIAYDRLGRADLAQRYFEVAAAKAPSEIRYRNNLAKLLLRTGQGAVAEGLSDVQPKLAALPDSNMPDFIASVAVDQPVLAINYSHEIQLVTTTELAVLAQVADDNSGQSEPVKRVHQTKTIPIILAERGALNSYIPTRKMPVIEAKLVDYKPHNNSPFQPKPLREPIDRSGAMVNAAALPRRDGAKMERISLGEVRLVTLPQNKDDTGNQTGFDDFAQRLDSWLPQAIAQEQEHRYRGDANYDIMLAAVQRAQIEQAFDQIDEEVTAQVTKKMGPFAYIFYTHTSAANI